MRVSGPDDTAGIRRALLDFSIDPEVRRLASFIMSDPERTALHDATWTTVSIVARVRADLLLNATPLWSRTEVRDFDAFATGEGRTQECMPLSGARKGSATSGSRRPSR